MWALDEAEWYVTHIVVAQPAHFCLCAQMQRITGSRARDGPWEVLRRGATSCRSSCTWFAQVRPRTRQSSVESVVELQRPRGAATVGHSGACRDMPLPASGVAALGQGPESATRFMSVGSSVSSATCREESPRARHQFGRRPPRWNTVAVLAWP